MSHLVESIYVCWAGGAGEGRELLGGSAAAVVPGPGPAALIQAAPPRRGHSCGRSGD